MSCDIFTLLFEKSLAGRPVHLKINLVMLCQFSTALEKEAAIPKICIERLLWKLWRIAESLFS